MPKNFANKSSNSRFKKPAGRSGGKQKKAYERPPESAFLSLGEFDPTELDDYDESKNYPIYTGFLNASPDAVEMWMNNGDIFNPEYGTLGLSVACWEKDGRLNCTVKFPYVEEEEEEAPAWRGDKKPAAKKPAASKVRGIAPLREAAKPGATAKKLKAVAAVEDEVEDDEDELSDIPF